AARARAADDEAQGSRSPSRARSETATSPDPADAATTSRETTQQRPENDPPPALTLPITYEPDTSYPGNRIFGTGTLESSNESPSPCPELIRLNSALRGDGCGRSETSFDPTQAASAAESQAERKAKLGHVP